MKRIYAINNIGVKVSRKFWDKWYPDNDYMKCVGSPSDIRKICHVLDMIGYNRMYTDAPIMREGRKYEVHFPESWHVGARYVVYRA